MKWPDFSDPQIFYVAVAFLQPADLGELQPELEALGKQRNVRLLVQPCPYEAMEFLFGADRDLLSHQSTMDQHVFFKVLMLKGNTPRATVEEVADHYLAYFLAVLDQDEAKVKREAAELGRLAPFFAGGEPVKKNP